MLKKTTTFDVTTTYGEHDLAETSLFLGGYINFGYWEGIDLTKTISHEQRIDASRQLYEKVLHALNMQPDAHVLEVGCGRGYGVKLLAQHYPTASIVGLDLLATQIEKAKQLHTDTLQANQKIHFMNGSAESLPFDEATFDRIYSVEALQHFKQPTRFLSEAYRALKPNGKLVITTFFWSHQDAIDTQALHELFPYVAQGIDYFLPINDICETLRALGFKVSCQSIGEHVWHGFDKWLVQTDFHDQWGRWGRNWLKAVKRNWVDYYLIEADKQD